MPTARFVLFQHHQFATSCLIYSSVILRKSTYVNCSTPVLSLAEG